MQTLPKTLAVVLVTGSAFGLAACNSSSKSCVNNECNVTLRGDGASSKLGKRGTVVKLISTENGTATFSVDGTRLTCTEGQAVDYRSAEIVCEDIGDSEIKLHVSGLK